MSRPQSLVARPAVAAATRCESQTDESAARRVTADFMAAAEGAHRALRLGSAAAGREPHESAQNLRPRQIRRFYASAPAACRNLAAPTCKQQLTGKEPGGLPLTRHDLPRHSSAAQFDSPPDRNRRICLAEARIFTASALSA